MKEEEATADTVIEEVRERRRQLCAEFDNDPVRLVEYFMELQNKPEFRDRLLYRPDDRDRSGKSAA